MPSGQTALARRVQWYLSVPCPGTGWKHHGNRLSWEHLNVTEEELLGLGAEIHRKPRQIFFGYESLDVQCYHWACR